MIIDVAQYGLVADNTTDNTPALRRMLNAIKGAENVTLVFGEGIYHFYPEYASELLLYIPNHDEDALKRVAFALDAQAGLNIRGRDTAFMFHADIIPFYFSGCQGINVSGIAIDYAIPVYSEASIVSASEKELTIAIDIAKYPYEIISERLYFRRNGELQPLLRWLELDAQRQAPVYDTHDLVFGEALGGLTPRCVEHCAGQVTLTLPAGKPCFLNSSRAGNKLILRHHLRAHPCFYCANCTDIRLSDINVYHASGMAFIAEHTRDILLQNFNVKINPQSPRIFTATADATHFVYCSGTITIEHCLFENQLDDPVNIHGIYARIAKPVSRDTVIVQLMHPQHKGVCMGKAGERIRIVNNDTMLECFTTTIKSICALNKDYIELQLCEPCDSLKPGYVIENLAYVPDVIIKDCVFRNNRARGLLLTSAGKVLIEGNYFSVPGAAILLEGDSNNWYESGCTTDITVCNNTFDNCAYVSDWGNAPIQVTPSTVLTDGEARFHKLLVLRDNTFRCFDERLIYAKHIERIDFTDNTIIATEDFAPLGHERYHMENVPCFTQSNNEFT